METGLAEPVVVTSIAFWIGPLIQAGAILVSAACVAWMIRTNRQIARQRAVIDLIVKQQTDSDMIAARNKFVSLKKAGNIGTFAGADKRDGEEAVAIRFILNMYEVVAIGIKTGAYDEAIYKRWCKTTAVEDWKACKEFVEETQTRVGPNVYIEFRDLARSWANATEIHQM